ncbi:MAG: hypothetical protein HY748_09780 [Elusimicrobia bacterium]|nr:hypothetical protein [Elusimicrobiota bacterium]
MNAPAWKAVAVVALCCGAAVSRAGDSAEYQTITVESGDDILLVAERHLKDPSAWHEILKYNSLPSSDPTAILPAMTLRLPARLLKSDPQAEVEADRRGVAQPDSPSAKPAAGGLTGGVPIPDIRGLRGALAGSGFGDAVSGYRVECGESRDLARPLARKTFDAESPITPRALKLRRGTYWCRIAEIDLLGVRGKFSETRLYGTGAPPAAGSLESRLTIIRPDEGDLIGTRTYRVRGKIAPNLKVMVNGLPAHPDAEGFFSVSVPLNLGRNTIQFAVSDDAGNLRFLDRTVTCRP